MFVIGSIIAACGGDFSGLEVIGKFVGGAVLVSNNVVIYTTGVADYCYCTDCYYCNVLCRFIKVERRCCILYEL